MEMYTKFESRSSRAKAIAFHPTRTWVLVGLYSSTIQLWDHRMGCIVDRFEGHQGPVRGLDVHPTQQIFVSCGDDQLIRVWSLSERRLLFTLDGHQDYVRTAFFHKELPWIISASDDQTIRIWDWQARKEIALLTGHNHWVSCAVFHPTEDLIISSSLDCTVRAWDYSGLRRKHSAVGMLGGVGVPGMPAGLPAGMGIPGLPNRSGPHNINGMDDDMFADQVITKFILDGHDRGVTWVACHPTQPLIVSSSDDRTLKVWRMSESRAWEIDTCHGHRDEVTGVAFDADADVIISCSADKTLRTWDLNKRTPLATFKSDGDGAVTSSENSTTNLSDTSGSRYWGLAMHPTLNQIGAALDNGAKVFKITIDRPASTLVSQGLLYVGKDRVLRLHTPGKSADATLGSVAQSAGNFELSPRTISFNPSESTVLCTYAVHNSDMQQYFYAMFSTAGGSAKLKFRSEGRSARFISRNRFCVLRNKTTLEVYDMSNERTKSVELPVKTLYLEVGPSQGQLLLISEKSLILYDVQHSKVVAKITADGFKRAVWSPNGQHVALLARHEIIIATKDLHQVAKIFETIRVKNLAWDKNLPIFVYSTFSHLKYGLMNGDTGILCTLDSVQYVVEVSNAEATLLDRNSQIVYRSIDPTEYRFKLALINKNFGEVARLIETSQLVGQSIIAYLQKRGYPEIALEFVQDPKTRLDLAIESGDLAVASEAAVQLQSPAFDQILGQAALEQGNHDIVEDVYQRQHDLDKLAFIYLATGNRSRLQRLEQLAMQRGAASARFQTSLFLNSTENRIELLKEAGLAPLAYALAKSLGLYDDAEQIREENGVAEQDIKLSLKSSGELGTPAVKFETWKENWPVNKREAVSITSLAKLSISDPLEGATGGADNAGARAASAATSHSSATANVEEDAGEDAWDLDDQLDENDIVAIPSAAEAVAAVGGAAPSVADKWAQSSTIPADHIAAGSFESAAQLLHNQIGVVKFGPLKERFFDVYSASKLAVPGHDGLPPLKYYVHRGTDNKRPYVPGFDHLQTRLNEAFSQVMANQLELAVDSFRAVLHTAVTVAVESEKEEAQVYKFIDTCKNYILAFSIELQRRALPKDNVKRNLELAAYFTKPILRPAHAGLPLRTAAIQASNAKNYSLASHFAAEYLKIDTSGPGATKMAANKQRWDAAKSLDAVSIDFDMYAQFDIDPKSFTPIYEGQPVVYEPLTKTKYHADHKGIVCTITGFTEVGAVGPGLRLRA